MTPSEAEVLQQSSQPFWDSQIWRVAVNIQHRYEKGYEPSDLDSLRLDLRRLRSNPANKTKYRQIGSLWIDVCNCGLRLEQAGKAVVCSGDSTEKVLAQFKGLVGRTIERVHIAPPGGDTDFVLEDGTVLRCFPATARGGLSWRISSDDDTAYDCSVSL
jgi:hypothetical protein